MAASWAVGGTGTRPGENTNNAEYWAQQAQAVAQGQLGWYATPQELQSAHPSGQNGQWAIIGTTDTIWTWDSDTGAWKNSSVKTDLSGYYTKEQADAEFAPKSHNSATGVYGIGNGTVYGHVKLSDTAGNSGASAGVAATPKSVQEALKTLPVINAGITNISPLNPGQETPYEVTFKTPMPDINYAVVLGLSYGGAYWANICLNCISKSTNGFMFSARNDVGAGQTAAATIDWIAVHQ